MLNLLSPSDILSRLSRLRMPKTPPTIFHVTHWKAGSQWLYKILRDCAAERVIPTEMNVAHFLEKPVQPGMIYPAIYLTKQQFDSVPLPPNSQRFVIIRDLRDTLISWYFSVKVSHLILSTRMEEQRRQLTSRNEEEGLLLALEQMEFIANIQRSWLEAGEPLIRYEDLIEHDETILRQVLLKKCRLPVSRSQLTEVLRANRFDQFTGGRPRGQEDVTSHLRKGIAGD